MEIITMIFALSFTGPFVGYFLMLRDRNRPRWHAVVGAIIGGGLPATVWGAAIALEGIAFVDSMPYVIAAMMYGAFIGLGGLAARSLGAWFSRPAE